MRQFPPMPETLDVKVVVIGDGAVGKTCLLSVYSQDEFPYDHVPTVTDNYTTAIKVQNIEVDLSLWDTAGQDEYKQIRCLSYPGTDVFLLCYNMVNATSLHNIRDKWFPEIHHYNPDTKVILVGTKADLLEDEETFQSLKEGALPTAEQIEEVAQYVNAEKHMTCSALENKGVADVFEAAVRCFITVPPSRPNRTRCLLL